MTKYSLTEKIGHFKLEEFLITGQMPPDAVAEAIVEHHIKVMNPVRDALGAAINVSEHSGYRPKWYEEQRKRSGTSQHCFEAPFTKGAADYTAANVRRLLDLMVEMTPFTRLCWYPKDNFIHADYKPTGSGKKEIYNCQSPTSKWVLVRTV